MIKMAILNFGYLTGFLLKIIGQKNFKINLMGRSSQVLSDIENKKKELELIEAEIEAANTEAEIIIQTARENAERLIKETEEQVDDVKEKGLSRRYPKSRRRCCGNLKVSFNIPG